MVEPDATAPPPEVAPEEQPPATAATQQEPPAAAEGEGDHKRTPSGPAWKATAQALIALKKGSQLLKYGRKGKPKFTPFRLSNDESTLIWVSNNKEKSLKLASVSRVLSGQRTLVFQRFLLSEKDHLSFSLIYNDGKRSLDLICKDKVEAEVWFTGLNALISPGQHGSQPQRINGIRNGGFSFDVNSLLQQSSLSALFFL